MKKRYLLSVLIGLICLYLAFRKVDWGQVGLAFKSADYMLIPLFIAAHLVGMLIRGLRWRLILEPVKKTRYRNIISALAIGFMANFIFPARAGEVIRAYVIGLREEISKSASFATVVLERLFDGFSILLFLAIFPLFMEVPTGKEALMSGVRMAGLMALLLYVVVMGFLFLLWKMPGPFMKTIDWICRPMPEKLSGFVKRLVSSFGQGLDMLGNVGHLISVMGWSLILWVILGLGNWILLEAFGLGLPLFAGLFLVVVQSFGTMVPSPGYIGAFHYAHVLGLALFGVSKAVSLSVAILLHGLVFLTYVILGIVFIWVEGLGLGIVRVREAEYE